MYPVVIPRTEIKTDIVPLCEMLDIAGVYYEIPERIGNPLGLKECILLDFSRHTYHSIHRRDDLILVRSDRAEPGIYGPGKKFVESRERRCGRFPHIYPVMPDKHPDHTVENPLRQTDFSNPSKPPAHSVLG
jgi:hypothetical protein